MTDAVMIMPSPSIYFVQGLNLLASSAPHDPQSGGVASKSASAKEYLLRVAKRYPSSIFDISRLALRAFRVSDVSNMSHGPS